MKIPYKPKPIIDAEIFSIEAIHKKYWKDFCDVCYPHFGFENEEDGDRTYEQKYDTFRRCHNMIREHFNWHEELMFNVTEDDLKRFNKAYSLFKSLSTTDNATIPMLLVLLRMEQSLWNRLKEDRKMMEYVYPREYFLTYEKYEQYEMGTPEDLPSDEHVMANIGVLEKHICDGLIDERKWDERWRREINKFSSHHIDYEEKNKVELWVTVGEFANQLSRQIVSSLNYALHESFTKFECNVAKGSGDVVKAIVYRLFISFQRSLPEIKTFFDDYPAHLCMSKLMQSRDELIKEFKQTKLGAHWYECILLPEGLEKVGKFLMNHRDSISKEEENRFFYLLDEISIMTDILQGNALKYWLNVEFDKMSEDNTNEEVGINEKVNEIKSYPQSKLDGIFHPSLDMNKIKEGINGIIITKGKESFFQESPVKWWFVVHKVLEEIDWLDDKQDTKFINWVKDVYGWNHKTHNFKSILSGFKHTPSTKWDANTVKNMNTGRQYRDLADYVRNTFVDINTNGKITDKVAFLRRGFDNQPMYIAHDLRRNK